MRATQLADGATDCGPVHNAGARTFDADQARLRDEFLSMPALCLTVEQVARLMNVTVFSANRLLTGLERDRFLIRTATGRYRLAEPLES